MNKLLALGGIGAILVGFFLLVLPVSHIPLLDANRQVLVESERGGICAGNVYMQTRGAGSEEAMADCLSTSTVEDTIDHRRVTPGFCNGLIGAGFPIGLEECLGIMLSRQFWPTATGTLTSAWNKRFPYPGDFLSSNVPQTGGESRTGERETTDREGFDR